MSSPTVSGHSKLLICDTNIVVLLYFFKKSVLFDFPYSMGEVEVHESVIDKLRGWKTQCYIWQNVKLGVFVVMVS